MAEVFFLLVHIGYGRNGREAGGMKKRRQWTTYSGSRKRVAPRTRTSRVSRGKEMGVPRLWVQLIVCGGAVCGAHWPQAADAGELKRAARDAGAVAGARRGLHLGVFRGRACGIRRAGLGRFAVGGLCRGVWRREQGAGGLGQSDRHDGLGAGRLRPHERAGAARTRRGRAAHFRLFRTRRRCPAR